MRENTKKILLSMYPSTGEAVWCTFAQLHTWVPGLSKAGLQSALFLLDKQELLRIDKATTQWRYSLSSHGISQLETLFPALSDRTRQQQWLLLIFLQAPKHDHNFRYLRNYLVQNQAVALTRAVYLVPSSLLERLKTELTGSYKNEVLLLEVGEWLFGDDYKVIGQKANLTDLHNLYSSISKELDRLTDIEVTQKILTQQEKDSFFSAFNRFLSVLAQDQSLLLRYFPDIEDAKAMLARFQNACKL